MATVLMGWELGGGLGHVMPLLVIARRLRDLGHRPIFAFSDVAGGAELPRREGFAVLQAPLWPLRRRRDGRVPPTANHADILATVGFADDRQLSANLGVWDALIELAQPDLVVADHSPGLCLAARGRVPVLVMGAGLPLPPPELEEFPVLQPKVRPLISQSLLFDRLNAAQSSRGEPPLPRLPALYDCEAHYVSCVPLLDPYAGHRDRPADGPLDPLPVAAPAPQERRIFVYYGVELPNVGSLMEGLARSGLEVDVYLRGATAAQRRALQRSTFRLFDSPPPLEEHLAECSHFVHHGGMGGAMACLAVGRPQVLIPSGLERWLNASALRSLGVARILRRKLTADDVATALRVAIADEALAARAAELAQGLDRGGPDGGLKRVIELCLSLIGE